MLLVGRLPTTDEVATMIVRARTGVAEGLMAMAQRLLGMAGEVALANGVGHLLEHGQQPLWQTLALLAAIRSTCSIAARSDQPWLKRHGATCASKSCRPC